MQDIKPKNKNFHRRGAEAQRKTKDGHESYKLTRIYFASLTERNDGMCFLHKHDLSRRAEKKSKSYNLCPRQRRVNAEVAENTEERIVVL